MTALGLAWALCWVPAITLLPGLALASLLRPTPGRDRVEARPGQDAWTTLAIALLATGLVAYAGFWLSWVDPALGEAFALVLPVSAAVVLVLQRRALEPALATWARWHLLTLVVAAFYLFTTYAVTHGLTRLVEEPLVRFLPGTLPPDNQLPLMFATRLHEGSDPRPYLYLRWQSSDRPPLQAGFTLMVLPWSRSGEVLRTYQVLGTWLQCWWVLALGTLAARTGLCRRATAIAVGACVLLPFFLLHGAFVWPKLLAAALVVLGLAFTPLLGSGREWTRTDTAVAGTAIGLALLAHAAPAFTLAGALLTATVVRLRVPWRRASLCAAAAALVLAPWVAYAKLYDPPGDLLLKIHLAGVAEQDGRSVARVIADAYEARTPGEIASTRVVNLRQLFVTATPPVAGPGWTAAVAAFVEGQFRCAFQALGVVNVGLALLGVGWWRRRESGSADAFALHIQKRLAGVAVASLVVWVAVMFEPGGTVLHQGSFADILLLAAAGAAGLARLRGLWLASLAALQLAAFAAFTAARPLLDTAGGTSPWTLRPSLLIGALLTGGLLPIAVHGAVVCLAERDARPPS